MTPAVRLDELGLDDPRLLEAARLIADCNIRERHAEFLDGDIRDAPKVVAHLERLGVLERASGLEGFLELNPLVRRVLGTPHERA